MDLKVIEKNYDDLKKNLPYAKIYYAVKANPFDEVIKLLAKKGSYFDIATVYELDQVLKLGVSPDRMSYGNTIKKEEDIAYAYKKGIRMFATDSINDLQKIARQAPGSRVYFRVLCEAGEADWPLSKKFGAYPDLVFKLMLSAKRLGLIPYGVSFHVGSQQRSIGSWDNAISKARYLFDAALEEGIELKLINMGGGFPAHYINPTQDLEEYAKEITHYLEEDFPEGLPEIIVEPGRSLVADAGIIVSEISLVAKKNASDISWVYVDLGKFTGLAETIDESIKYPIFMERESKKPLEEVILAGPTCDSMDTLYQNFKYKFPSDIKDGDRMYILTAGAYTYSYCSVCFNGFPPLKYYFWKK